MNEELIERKDKWKKILFESLFYLALFIFTFVCYLIFKPLFKVARKGVISQAFIAVLVTIDIAIIFFLKKYNKLTSNRLIALLVLLGFFIKLGYMLYTPYNVRQHDTVSNNHNGHEDYAWIIYTTGKFPTTNDYQFYHPPLNALIQAGFMHFSKPFLEMVNAMCGKIIFDTTSMHVLYETTQVLSVMYMTLTTIVGVKIISHFKMSGKASLLASIFIIFFPRFIQLSAQENNDAICIFLSFVAILYSLKWWENKNYLNLMVIAISIGLAMMSKLSGATICVTTAFIFIYEYVKSIKNKDKKQIVNLSIQYVAFLLVCAPLALWFQVYASIKFNQPLGYVFNKLNPALSVADYNFFQRFINIFDVRELTSGIYASPFENYNLFSYLIKTAIFGEFSYWQGEGFAFMSVVLNYLFVITCLVLLVITLVKYRKSGDFKFKATLLTIFITQVVMDLYFNIKMPYGCTMDFRYIVPITIAFSLVILFVNDKASQEEKKNIYLDIVNFLMIGMITFSNLFYMVAI